MTATAAMDLDQEGGQPEEQPGLTRSQRHEQRQAAAGYTRLSIRAHVDDVAIIKGFVAELIDRRKAAKPGFAGGKD